MSKRMDDNAVRWAEGDQGGHVESFFLKGNDPASRRAFWLKFTIFAPRGGGAAVGEVWAILFDPEEGHVAAKETYPIGETTVRPRQVGFTMGRSRLAPGSLASTEGTLTSPEGVVISWDLEYPGQRAPLYLFPHKAMYRAPLPKFKSLTPTSDTRFSGTIRAGDRAWEIADWPGMQGHNWGRAHAERYAWAHCNLFSGEEDAVFEGFSARIKLGPVVTPFITLVTLVHRSIPYSFTGPGCWLRASSDLDYTSWDFVARRGRRRLLGSLWTEPQDMVGLTYRNPGGDITHCLNSKIAHCELRLVEGGDVRLRLRSQGKAALEVAVKEPEHGIQMWV